MSRWTHRKRNNADRLIPIGISDWLARMRAKSDFEKTEDCLLFLRIKKLISQGEVDRIRRKLEMRLAEPPSKQRPLKELRGAPERRTRNNLQRPQPPYCTPPGYGNEDIET